MSTFFNKAENIVLIILCYGYKFIRGKATDFQERTNTVTIAVFQTAKLGDMVCSTPVFHALRLRYPRARIIVVGSKLNQEVLAHNYDINHYIVSEVSILSLIRTVRAVRAHVACVLNPDSRMLAAAFLGGIRFIVAPKVTEGFCPWQTKTYRLLLRLVRNVTHRMGHYAPREYLKTLEPLGIYAEDTTKHLSYSDESQKNVSAFLLAHSLKEKEFAIISPSAGNKIKNWTADRFARVAEYIVSKGLSVVVIGGSRDREEVRNMLHEVKESEGIIDASEKFSIDELKALITRAGLFVAVDTGPIYIAEVFGVPTVDIVGPMDEREQPPVGPYNLVVVPERDKPALHVMNARVYDKKEARRQTEAISVEMVCDAINNLMASR